MLDYWFRNSLICLTALSAFGLASSHADDAAKINSLTTAYKVLNAHHLLAEGDAPKVVAVTPAPEPSLASLVTLDPAESSLIPAPVEETRAVPGPVAMPKNGSLWTAYQVLIAKGLLKSSTPQTTRSTHVMARSTRVDRVVVDKSEHKLFLMRHGQPIREFAISLGGDPKGPKLAAGDMRTPEGVYTLDWRNPSSRFHKAIHISYPNENDRMRAQQRGVDPGGMVMIHGEHYMPALRNIYRRVTHADWTEGCIALRNENMDELWMTVADGTPIEIRP